MKTKVFTYTYLGEITFTNNTQNNTYKLIYNSFNLFHSRKNNRTITNHCL